MSVVQGWLGMVSVGELVQRRRAELRLTQEQLEELAGVSQNTISKMEMGLTKYPRGETIRKLAAVLELPVEEFHRAMGWVVEELPTESDDPLIAFVLMVQDVWSPSEKVIAVETLRKLMLDGHVREVEEA